MPDAPGIDHIVHCVHDLETARRRFQAMGFKLTPKALHPFGTANSLAQMQSSFLELLSVADPDRIPAHDGKRFSFAAHNAAFLSRGEGMSMLVLTSDDARADEAAWRARGLETFEPLYFERKATLPDGSEAQVAFTLAFVIDEAMPDAVFFSCQQHVPEAFWQPEYQSHPNGAVNLHSVTLIAEDPLRHVAFFEALLGSSRVHARGDRLESATGMGRIEVVAAGASAKRFAGVRMSAGARGARFAAAAVSVPDLNAATEGLERAGIDYLPASGHIIVPPASCFGLALELVEA